METLFILGVCSFFVVVVPCPVSPLRPLLPSPFSGLLPLMTPPIGILYSLSTPPIGVHSSLLTGVCSPLTASPLSALPPIPATTKGSSMGTHATSAPSTVLPLCHRYSAHPPPTWRRVFFLPFQRLRSYGRPKANPKGAYFLYPFSLCSP